MRREADELDHAIASMTRTHDETSTLLRSEFAKLDELAKASILRTIDSALSNTRILPLSAIIYTAASAGLMKAELDQLLLTKESESVESDCEADADRDVD